MFSFIAEFERAAEIRKIAVYRFLISFLVPELEQFKDEQFQTKTWSKTLSKSIKFVTSCAGHVDWMKK